MNYTYYQPYWIDNNELEHYGVKGMKWGKKRTPQELKDTKFSDAKVSETVNYLRANPVELPDVQVIADNQVAKTKKKTRVTKTVIRTTGKIKIKNMNNSISYFGKQIINKILGAFKKK